MRILHLTIRTVYFIWAVVLFCGIIFLGTLLSALAMVVVSKRKIVYVTMSFCCQVWFVLVGMRIKNSVEKPKESSSISPRIYVANHESYLDIPTLYAARLPFFVFLSKEEILRLPVIGFLCSRLAVCVKREDLKSKKKSMQKLMQTLEEDQTSIFIFPEGTFDAQKTEIIAFQLGAFTLATKCRIPIYPILLLDTAKRLHPKSICSLRWGINRILHLPPITAHLEDETPLNALELMHLCRETMLQARRRFVP